jgi:hypothetical protein
LDEWAVWLFNPDAKTPDKLSVECGAMQPTATLVVTTFDMF